MLSVNSFNVREQLAENQHALKITPVFTPTVSRLIYSA